ncbi:Folate-Biopterin Transporter (FBT) family [Phytophthora nicotianae]|uniref:Folate-Biopterin Transporter (FBT) family n=1 Tax=Phytophthora nicotianae TaxID=4792 RepID=A0A0W8D3V6_PHYNI|nr:Folate-Biopterin Transporter (FBT) family [Phytophthora nicotianae]
MKCAFVDCINPKLSTLYPCTVCERQVHHLCSNDLFDPENIAVHHRNASEDAWEGALRKFNHTSNVKDHLVAKHSSHPIGKAEATKRVKRVRRQLEDAFSQVPGSMTTDMTSVDHSTKGSMKQGALKKLWGPSNMQLRAYIAKWLINDGLPYNTVTSESFRSLMEVATGKPDVVVLSAQAFNDVLAASFLRFREVTKRLLEMEYTSVYKRPFLNLMHDMWAAGTGMKDVIGTSMSFIDKDWTWRC